MGRWALAAIAILALGTTACGGGDDDPAPVGPVASFTPGTATPGSVAQRAGSSSGRSFTINIDVTGVDDFFGAAFRIKFDPDFVSFQGKNDQVSFLRTHCPSTNPIFVTDASTVPGELIVTASCRQNAGGTITGKDVGNSETLIALTFQVRTFFNATADANSNGIPDGSLEFIDPREVCDSDQPVCTPIPVTWSAGSVRGS